MKKIFFHLVFILATFVANAQSTHDIVQRMAQNIASATINQMRAGGVAANTKIVVLNFLYQTAESDSLRTQLGSQLAGAVSQQLALEIQRKNLTYKVLYFTAGADSLMDQFFLQPPAHEATDFYRRYLQSITPDYYLCGSCRIENNFMRLACFNLRAQANKYVLESRDISVANQTSNANGNADVLRLQELLSVNNLPDAARFIAARVKFSTRSHSLKLANFVNRENG